MRASIRERQNRPAGIAISQEMNAHHKLLQTLVKGAHGRFECGQAGSSLVIAVARPHGLTKLSKALMPTSGGRNLDRLLNGIELHARKIINASSEHNCIVLGSLACDESGLRTLQNHMPFLWWPIERQVLEDILFHRVMVMTIYNPAHFWAGLEHRGFTLEWNVDGRKLKSAVKHVGDRKLSLEHIDSLQHLIWYGLMTEDSVLNMVDVLIDQSMAAKVGVERVELKPKMRSGPLKRAKAKI